MLAALAFVVFSRFGIFTKWIATTTYALAPAEWIPHRVRPHPSAGQDPGGRQSGVETGPNSQDLPGTPPEPLSQKERTEESRLNRKLAYLKRAGLFGENTQGARITRAASLIDLRNAYRLVHEVYLGTGFIEPEPKGIRIRIFETISDTATFVAKVNGSVVGVLSIVGDTPEAGLPSDASFKPELDALRAKGLRLCEATNQAVKCEYRRSSVSTELMRCAVAHMTAAGFDESVAAVSPSHDGFYELLGFRQIGSMRSYSCKVHDPVVALSMDITQYRQSADALTGPKAFVHRFLAGENHFLGYVEQWERQASHLFFDTELLHQLFYAERNFIEECTPDELSVLHRRWGHELFSAVTGSLFLPPRQPA